MAIVMMAEELEGGILVGVLAKEESEVRSQLELHFEVAVLFNGKQQQPNSVLEEEVEQEQDEKAGKEGKEEEKEEKEEKEEDAEQRRLHMGCGGDKKRKVKYCLCMAYNFVYFVANICARISS